MQTEIENEFVDQLTDGDAMEAEATQCETLTTKQMADLIAEIRGCPVPRWRVARLFEDGDLPAPPRFCNRRILLRCSLPAVIAALEARGWLPAEEPDHAGASA